MFIKRNSTLIIGLSILTLAIVLGAMPTEEISTPERDALVRQVRIDTVDETGTTRSIRLPGVTRAKAHAALAFAIPARIAERPVQVGQTVSSGQVIARLDSREYAFAERTAAAAVSELEIRLEQAHRDEERVSRLAAARAATTEELEQVQAGTETLTAAHDAATARLENTRRLLGETVLRAPFNGTVTAVHLEAGEWASAGKKVVEISGRDGIEIQVELPESMKPGVSVGTQVTVELPMSGITTTGRIFSVADSSVGAGSLFPAVIEVDSTDGVYAGAAAEVLVEFATERTLTVPLSAVLDSGSNRPSVFQIKDGQALRIAIEPGHLVGDRLTIRSDDLTEGDIVAVVGHTALVDGDEVEVN